MKSFRQYLAALDRLATAQSPQIDRKQLVRALLATTFIAGSQFLSAISATANPAPTPLTPSPLLPTRILLNGSFEAPAKSADGAGYGINEAYNNTPPIIWRTTEPGNASGTYKDQLEVWRGIRTVNGGYDGMAPAYPGDSANKQYAEINASTNASIYQDLCIMPSENVGWSLSHATRKKTTANPTNIMQVSITDPDGWANSKTPPVAQSNAYYSSLGDYSSSGIYPGTKAASTASITSAKPFVATTYNDGWKAYSGSWTSTNTSPKLLRFAFGAIQGSDNDISYGNFIDNVQLSLPALIDFLPPDPGTNVNVATTTEGNPNSTNPPYYYLSVRINGATAAGKVTIALNGLNQSRSFRLGTVKKGTATVTGLSATVDDNSIKLNIPAGTYNPNLPSDYIHIPIDFSDTRSGPNDNLLFTLQSVDSGSLTIKSTQCATDRITVETRLIDDDYQKRVELPVASPFKIAAH
jgi:hypothetical protein